MKPVNHPSNTRTLGAPTGWDQSGLPVEPLGVTDTEMNGVSCVMSFWQPDAEELAHLQAGALVGLSIVGRTMPPAAVVTFIAPTPVDLTGQPTEAALINLARFSGATIAGPENADREYAVFARRELAAFARMCRTGPALTNDQILDLAEKYLTPDFGDVLDFSRRLIALASPVQLTPQDDARGIERAALYVEKRADSYADEHGRYDHETGTTEFSDAGLEYHSTLCELVESIRALSTLPAKPAEDVAS